MFMFNHSFVGSMHNNFNLWFKDSECHQKLKDFLYIYFTLVYILILYFLLFFRRYYPQDTKMHALCIIYQSQRNSDLVITDTQARWIYPEVNITYSFIPWKKDSCYMFIWGGPDSLGHFRIDTYNSVLKIGYLK